MKPDNIHILACTSLLKQSKGISLILGPENFSIVKTKPLPKPFRKGETIKAEIISPGRLKGEMLAAASGRVISVTSCPYKKGTVKIKITKTKHNIFMARLV